MKKTAQGSTQRRQFLKNSLGVLGATLLVGIGVRAEEERRRKKPEGGAAGGGDSAPMVDPATDPMAKSTNYVEHRNDLKKAELKTDRQGVKFENQGCKSCQLFTAAGKKDGKDVGKCTLFPGKLVNADGWCSSWSKKA